MRLRNLIWAGLFCVSTCLGSVPFALGQEKAKETGGEKPAAKEPAAKESAAKESAAKESEKKEGGDAQAAGSAKAEYEKRLVEWKQLLKDLRETRLKYDSANKEELDGIRKQWTDLVAKGETLIPPLREAAKNAYLAAPNEDRQLTRFVAKLLEDALARDHFEVTADLAQALIDNNAGVKEAVEAAGIANFVLNDYARADQYLKQAKSDGSLTPNGEKYFFELDNYKEFWAKEEELRKKEAEADDLPRIKITTTKGEMVAELFENEAPETVGNFVSLVEQKFYDGLKFHRVLPGFMAQGGCPKGDGTGGPGYNIYCECKKPEHRNHFRGSLSMAHAGPNTGGSQFFLTFTPTSHLNGRHTVFGRIIEGLDVLEKLQRIDPEAKGDRPNMDQIVKMEVIRKRDHEYVPHKVQ